MSAQETLESLERRFKNTDIDWEFLLECAYLHLLDDEKDVVFLDIGGHAGRHASVLLDNLDVAKAIVFEPLPDQCNELRDRFRGNSRVEVRQIALGNENSERTFYFNRTSPEESGLQERTFFNKDGVQDLAEIHVTVMRLDDLGLGDRVDYLKIDTEGGELDILAGGTTLLQQAKPIVSVEYGPGGYDAYGYSADDLFNFGLGAEYVVSDLFGNLFDSLEAWRACVARYYWDFLLIPKERLAGLSGRLSSLQAASIEAYRKQHGVDLLPGQR